MDLISRQDAIDAIERSGLTDDSCDTAIRLIEILPSAQRGDYIHRQRLVEQLKHLNKFNNNDCPEWVYKVIEGM